GDAAAYALWPYIGHATADGLIAAPSPRHGPLGKHLQGAPATQPPAGSPEAVPAHASRVLQSRYQQVSRMQQHRAGAASLPVQHHGDANACATLPMPTPQDNVAKDSAAHSSQQGGSKVQGQGEPVTETPVAESEEVTGTPLVPTQTPPANNHDVQEESPPVTEIPATDNGDPVCAIAVESGSLEINDFEGEALMPLELPDVDSWDSDDLWGLGE
ncbi:hypothetical protein LTR53_011405, partial [Teratosphaeriaceae sp. CCFEE 6253]